MFIELDERLYEKPQTCEIQEAMGIHIGLVEYGLTRIWRWFARNTSDGKLFAKRGLEKGLEQLDRMAGIQTRGFAQAMIDVGWIEIEDGDIFVIVDFFKHIGSANRKAIKAADRKRAERARRKAEADKAEKSNSDPIAAASVTGAAARVTGGAASVTGGANGLPTATATAKATTKAKPLRNPDCALSERRARETPEVESANAWENEQADGQGALHRLLAAWEDIWRESRGERYAFRPYKDEASILECLRHAEGDERLVEDRMRRLITNPPDVWLAQNACPRVLSQNWSQLAITVPTKEHARLHGWRSGVTIIDDNDEVA